MIPLVAYRREFDILADVIRSTAEKIEAETGHRLAYQIGTMIELPRAALRAKETERRPNGAEFFSFGTNDLTQTCLGLSRDDAAPILSNYAGKGIFERDPFVSIDEAGVGELIRIGVDAAVAPVARVSRSGSAASMAATLTPSPSSTSSASTTSPARPSASRSRVWRPLARLSPHAAAAQADQKFKASCGRDRHRRRDADALAAVRDSLA